MAFLIRKAAPLAQSQFPCLLALINSLLKNNLLSSKPKFKKAAVSFDAYRRLFYNQIFDLD